MKIIISIGYSILKIIFTSIPAIVTFYLTGWSKWNTDLWNLNLSFWLIFWFIVSSIFVYWIEFNIKESEIRKKYINKIIIWFLFVIWLIISWVYAYNMVQIDNNWIFKFKNSYYYLALSCWIIIVFISEIFYNFHNSNAILEIYNSIEKKNDNNKETIQQEVVNQQKNLNNLISNKVKENG